MRNFLPLPQFFWYCTLTCVLIDPRQDVVVAQDVLDASFGDQRPQSSAAAEGVGDVVGVPAGRPERRRAYLVIGATTVGQDQTDEKSCADGGQKEFAHRRPPL